MKKYLPPIGLLLVLLLLVSACAPVVSLKKQEALEKTLAEELEEDFHPVFRFAVASDVHISADDETNALRLQKLFETAYRYADAHPDYQLLDALVLTGDNCESGADAEYEILNRVIGENIRPETEFISVMGNHEFRETGHEGFVRHMGHPLDTHTVVKGFHFIGISPTPNDTWHSPKQILWMAKELKKAEADDPDKPIFTMQHGHIWRTVYVSRSWYTQMSVPLHMVYSKYPQVINFSGHSHGPVNNPINIWQSGYTLLGAGTLNYFEMERDIGDNTVPEGARNAAQYLIVEVDAANRVRIRPFNILTEDFMKTPASTDDPEKQLVWQIDAPKDKSTFAYTSARKKTARAPWFGEGDAISVEESAPTSMTLSFPQAQDDVCVYGYRILFTESGQKKAAVVKEVYSEYYFEPMPERRTVTVEGLTPGTAYEVSVVPLNVWLDEGAPIKGYVATPEE